MRWKTILPLILAVFSIGSNLVFASIQIEEVVVSGSGRTRDQAVINCLVEAIRQKRGVAVDALSEVRFVLEDVFYKDGGEQFFKKEISDSVAEEIHMQTNGLIDRYEILKCDKMHDGTWEAKIRVFVPVYRRRADRSARSTLAVMPIMPNHGLKSEHGLDVKEVARQITRRLTTQLVQTRHYSILDREYGVEFEKERQFILSGNLPVREMARLEEQLGADYLLIGTLSEVKSSVTSREVHGMDVIRYSAFLNLDIRAVEFATRQVHRADNITVSIDRVADLRSPADRRRQAHLKDEIPSGLIAELVDDVSKQLNEGFLDILMPIRVLEVQNGQVYLNQGGSRLQEDQKLTILGPHRDVTDPGTGSRIRIDGGRLAEIMVRDVMEDYSVASILEGNEDDIKPGLRCKR